MTAVAEGQPPPTAVTTLLGRAQLPHAAPCLASLLACCRDPIRLVVHEDGTFDEAAHETLAAAIGPFELRSRRDGDAEAEAALAPYPALLAFRRSNPLGLKLFDVALLSPGPLAYVDADILFLRPFTGLFSLPSAYQAAFMEDTQNAYSLRSWIAWSHGVRLGRRINSGLVLLGTDLDLDALEWLFRVPGFGRPEVWAEQTAWAFLAARTAAATVDSSQLTFPTRETGSTAALHFVSPLRATLATYLATPQAPPEQPPIAFRFRATERALVSDLALAELSRLVLRIFSP